MLISCNEGKLLFYLYFAVLIMITGNMSENLKNYEVGAYEVVNLFRLIVTVFHGV